MDDPRHPRRSHRSQGHSHSPHNSSSRHHRHRDRDSRSSSKSRDHHSRERHSRHHHHHHRRHKRTRSPSPAIVRPLNAPRISRHDFEFHKDVFADYLDIQKGLILSELDRAEAKGRFKRFVTHYNHGELARGWYDRIVNRRASDSSKVPEEQKSGFGKYEDSTRPEMKKQRVDTPQSDKRDKRDQSEEVNESENGESSEEIVGPLLPGQQPPKRSRARGPTIPSKEDLDLQNELLHEDQTLQHLDLHHARKQERILEKERLEELVPRAAAGTHERKLEKKAELNAKMKSFREKSPDLEVNEETLMGSGGTDGFKQRKAAIERKKNDREIRKEELLRARIAEREERLQQHRDKEEKTMAMLKQLASRFSN